MKRSNNKGIGLIELLVVIAVIALTTPLLFWVFAYGIQSYSSYNRYIDQHYKVMDVTQRIRKDIEEAAAFKIAYDATVTPIKASVLTLWIPDEDGDIDTFSIKTWRFDGGRLSFKSGSGSFDAGRAATLEESGYSEVLGGLDTDTVTASPNYMPTRFEKIDDRILLSIKPFNDNKIMSKSRNVTKAVVTEFSFRYKEEIY